MVLLAVLFIFGFALPQATEVTPRLHKQHGKERLSVRNNTKYSGNYEVTWN